jgi:hypothetical protein
MSPWTRRMLTIPDASPFAEIVSDLYRVVQRARDRAASQRSAQNRRYEALARHVAEMHVELFRLERELGPSLGEADHRRLSRILGLWQDTDVRVTCPEGQQLTDELAEQVEVLSAEVRPGVSLATIERVDQPVVTVGSHVFRGKVRVALPAGNSSRRNGDGQEHSD